jgi:predicted methyltransferase
MVAAIKNIPVVRVELSPETNRYTETENSTTAEALRIAAMGHDPSINWVKRTTITAMARHPLLAEPGR